MVLKKCKMKKAPGIDGITYEFFVNAPLSFQLELLRLLNFIFLTSDIPSAFREAIIIPIHKKGDPNVESNYRGLSLLNTLYKIFTALILDRIQTWVDVNNILNEYQAGFRRNYSTVDNIFCLTSIVCINFSCKKKTYAFFVDFKCAFDKLPRNSLFYKLTGMGLSNKMVVILMSIYSETVSQVWNGKEMSAAFSVDLGVKQGCLLSPLLFALYLNDLHDFLPGGIQINGVTIKILMYADDIVLLSTCPIILQRMINSLSIYCDTWGLEVNLDKSKVMIFREGPRISRSLSFTYNNRNIEIVNQYQYLGILLTYNLSYRKHIDIKLKTAKTAINANWSNFILDPNIDVSNKLKIFNAAAKSILLYGAQVWGFIEFDEVEQLLRFFLKKILQLPNNAPNYLLSLETGTQSLYVCTLRLHLDYIRKVASMPPSRLPFILANVTFDKKISWAAKWQLLYTEFNISLPDCLSTPGLKTQHETIISFVADSYTNNCIQKARNSSNHDLYSQLCYAVQPIVYSNVPSQTLGIFIKARGGMLALNGNPFTSSFSSECSICNLQEVENVHHLVGVCPIYNLFRIQLFGKPQLSLAEVIALLNGHNLAALTEFLKLSLKYRYLITNEF